MSFRNRKLSDFGHCGKGVRVLEPFLCSVPGRVHIGSNVFINADCLFLVEGTASIHIRSNVIFGPGVSIYCSTHPVTPAKGRRKDRRFASVVIENDVWVGGGAIILPGVTIGARSVIGAGSVVTDDVPADMLVVGNPAKVVRSL